MQSIKNSKSRLLRLSSEDKSVGTQGKFTIDIASAGGIIDNVNGFIVHSIQCPNVFDNVTSYNNVLSLTSGAGATDFTITLATGYYYVDDLVTALQTAINAAITTDTVVISRTGTDPNKKLAFHFVGDDYTIDSTGTSTMLDSLGITSALFCAEAVTTSAQSIPNLIGETDLYVHSKTLCPNNLIEGNGSFSVIDKLNLDQPFGAMCYSSFDQEDTHMMKYVPYESKKTIRSIQITLRNRAGNILILPDNFDFSMMLMVYYS
jgi:hypothetical protein